MNDDLKQLFREGALEHLTELEEALLRLEQNPQDGPEIARIFRVMHTLKGSSAMVGLTDVSAFAHELESEFDGIRMGHSQVTPALINLSLQARDQLLMLINAHFGGEAASAERGTDLLDRIRQGKAVTVVDPRTFLLNRAGTMLGEWMAMLTTLAESPFQPCLITKAHCWIHLVRHLARSAGGDCVVEFLEEVEAAWDDLGRHPEALTRAIVDLTVQAGQEAQAMLRELAGGLTMDLNADPQALLDSLERPLEIRRRLAAIRASFRELPPKSAPGPTKLYHLRLRLPTQRFPPGCTGAWLVARIRQMGEVKVLRQPAAEAGHPGHHPCLVAASPLPVTPLTRVNGPIPEVPVVFAEGGLVIRRTA